MIISVKLFLIKENTFLNILGTFLFYQNILKLSPK